MNALSRLQIASHIHYHLKRHGSPGIDIGLMLHDERYARRVLKLCAADGDATLKSLGRQFKGIEAVITKPSPVATSGTAFAVR